MDKFIIRRPPLPSKRSSVADGNSPDSDNENQTPEKVAATLPSDTTKMRTYKSNLTYNEAWRQGYPWMDYDPSLKGMVCTVCKVYGKVPVQARGAWVSRPVDNWVKATALLKKHEKSEWHLAAVEKKALSLSAQSHGDVVDIIVTPSEGEKKRNHELIKKLICSLYFLVKHYIPHTTTFESLLTPQIGDWARIDSFRTNTPIVALSGSPGVTRP